MEMGGKDICISEEYVLLYVFSYFFETRSCTFEYCTIYIFCYSHKVVFNCPFPEKRSHLASEPL